MATRSSILAWRIPGTEEPGGLPSMGSHGVGHDCSDLAAAVAARSSTGASLEALASWVALVIKNLPANAGDARDASLICGSGRSPGVGNGNLLNYFLLGKGSQRFGHE